MRWLTRLFAKEKPPADTSLISPIQNLTRQYPEDGIASPKDLKWILRDADTGLTSRYMELLDTISNDFKVASVLRTRKLAVAGACWHLEPPEGDISDQAKAICDETTDFLKRAPDFTQLKMDQLDAHYRGFASMRLRYEVVEGRIMIVEQEPIESRYFRFDNACTPFITTFDNPEGVPMPPEYLFHVVRDKPGPVTRGGTGRSISKLWLYKGFNLIDLAGYVEKYGQPHIQVLLPPGLVDGAPELERAKDAARSIIADNIGLVPSGVTIEVLESIKQTSTVNDTYLAFMRWLDEGIAIAELGHTLTSGASNVGGLGHGGEAEQAADVKQDIKEYDARSLENHIDTQIILPRNMRQYGKTAPMPRMCIEVQEEDDMVQLATANKLRAETIQILKLAGLDVSVSQVRREFGLEEPEGDDDILKGETPEPLPVAPPPNGKKPQAPNANA